MASLKVALAMLVLACAGCAVLDPQGASLSDADAALGDALIAARAPAQEQRAALTRAQQQLAANPRPVNRLRLGALLALVPPPLRDDARASDLLAPIADAGSAGTGRIAALLLTAIAEQQRLAREADRVVREADRNARERDRLDKERDKREEALRQQVEALRAIERNVQERSERLRRQSR